MIKLMVVDDQSLIRQGLTTYLNTEEQLQVVATASDGKEAFEEALRHEPDVVLMDIRMPGVDGVIGTRMIKQELPHVQVLMLTTFDDIELIFNALEEGASGYLLKDMPMEAIVQSIFTVHSGGVVLEPEVSAKLLDRLKALEALSPRSFTLNRDPRLQLVKELSEREKEVLSLIGRGMNNKEIAAQLFISEGTAKNHVSSVMAKLQFRDRTQAAIFAVKHGF